MSRDEIRLELLKLAHTHAKSSDEVIGRAAEYEKFVVGTEKKSEEVTATAEVKRGPGRPRQNTDNPTVSA